LDLSAADVLLIHEQEEGTPVVLGSVGATWRDALDTFLDAGGIVIALDNANTTGRIVDAAGLFSITAAMEYRRGIQQRVVDEDSPLAEGVPATYPAPNGTYAFEGITEGSVVVTEPSGSPVVVHRAR
jgi:hypothetical protein